MGNLTEMSINDNVSTLNVLEQWGVRSEHWNGVRKDAVRAQLVSKAFGGSREGLDGMLVLAHDAKRFEKELVGRMRRILSDKFGKRILAPSPPAEFTLENLMHWRRYNLREAYLPDVDIAENRSIPGFVKPGDWFYRMIREKLVKPWNDVSPTQLIPGWYLIDCTPSVDYTDGTQLYPNDRFARIIRELRAAEKIGKHPETPAGSRFSIVPESEWDTVCSAIATDPEVGLTANATVRLERYVEFVAIGNCYDPQRGQFSSWEWFGDSLEDGCRLYGGRESGGLANVNYDHAANRNRNIAGRPLVVSFCGALSQILPGIPDRLADAQRRFRVYPRTRMPRT